MANQFLEGFSRGWNNIWNGISDGWKGFTSAIGDTWNRVSGTTANNEFSAQQAQLAREFESAEAAKNRDWQQYMSDTAIQRQTADAQRAGINPMALAGSGMGASVGSAAMPHSAAASASAPGRGGFVGLVARVASAAVAGGLASKFRNSAIKAAADGGSVIKAVDHAASSEGQHLSAAAEKRLDRELEKALAVLNDPNRNTPF